MPACIIQKADRYYRTGLQGKKGRESRPTLSHGLVAGEVQVSVPTVLGAHTELGDAARDNVLGVLERAEERVVLVHCIESIPKGG